MKRHSFISSLHRKKKIIKTFTRQYSQRCISARSDDSPVFLFLFPGCGDALAVLLLFNEREFNFQARTTRPWSLCVSVCRGKSTTYKHNMQAKKKRERKSVCVIFFWPHGRFCFLRSQGKNWEKISSIFAVVKTWNQTNTSNVEKKKT